MGQDPWIELESVIRAQLALQVELSLDRHHRFMLEHGLAECRHVVDVGTGNGLFLEQVAERHPTIQFSGIDDKAHMVREASSRTAARVDWVQADALDDRASQVLSTADGVLMRYFVLHMHDTSVTVPKILSSVKPGTRLWIFDLDADHSVCEPAEEAYTAFLDLVRSFCDRNSVEIRTATMLPPILEAAGFRVDEVAVEPFDNQHVDPGALAEYLLREATLYQYFLGLGPQSEMLDRLRHLLCDVIRKDTHYVRYGMAMVSATKRAGPAARGRPGGARDEESGCHGPATRIFP